MAQSLSSHLYQVWENGTVPLLSSPPSFREWHSPPPLISTKLGRMAQSLSPHLYQAYFTVPLPLISSKLGRIAKSPSHDLYQAYGTVPLPFISTKLGRMAQSPSPHLYQAYGTVPSPSSLPRLVECQSPPPLISTKLTAQSPPLDLYQAW
jgi:hypothetical protein